MKMEKIRQAAVAGAFYPATEAEIKEHLSSLLKPVAKPRKATACICPHAGWVYSGSTSAKLFSSIIVPDKIILIGPNHHGIGTVAGIDSSSFWQFPFGKVMVDEGLRRQILTDAKCLAINAACHQQEHSLEVIVPFLYAMNQNISIAPISLYSSSLPLVMEIGEAIAKAVAKQKKDGADVLILASSDMTHFLPDDTARAIDKQSIELIKKMELSKILQSGMQQKMCGAAPIATAIHAAKLLGATEAELINYSTSADASGDKSSVVGYSAFAIY